MTIHGIYLFDWLIHICLMYYEQYFIYVFTTKQYFMQVQTGL